VARVKLQAHGLSDVGQKRDHNEDRFLVDEPLGLYVVCDGMGGHAAGEVASALAVKTIEHVVRSELGEAAGEAPDMSRAAYVTDVLRRAVEAANSAVHELGKRDSRAHGAGTTCTVLCIRGQRGVLCHVGDSRLYVRRAAELHQLSLDHSFIADAVRHGFSPEQAADMFPSNLLTRAIGPLARVRIDTLEFDVLPGDTYLLCSDGLHGYFENGGELGQLLDGEPDKLPQRLIDLANERGGDDNITAVVVRAEAPASERQSRVHEDLSALAAMELFNELTYPELLEVASVLRTEEHEAGATILREGETSHCLYIIASGRVQVERNGSALTTLSAGSHFGEMALLTNRPRSATVRALDACRLLALDQPTLYPLFHGNPIIGLKFLWKLGQIQSLRLDETTLLLRPPAEQPGLETTLDLGSTQELFPPPFSRRRPR
jgi:serine/threonine protein phosphatase PrpC/CRP-like cAMP-binding protein